MPLSNGRPELNSSDNDRFDGEDCNRPPHSASRPQARKRAGIGQLIGSHLLGVVFCLLFPALVTGIAPVSWIEFHRQGGQVAAHVDICTLFFIPYRSVTIDPVIGIDNRFIAGHVTPRDHHHDRATRSEDEAYLIIHGANEQSINVPVSPVNIQQVKERVENFRTQSQDEELKLFVVANWKFSIIAGGLVSLLTVLYALGMVLAFYRLLWRLSGFSPSADPTLKIFPES